MSYIEHPIGGGYLPNDREARYNMITEKIHQPYAELYEKKYCDNCKFFAESEVEFAEGYCMKNVANTLCGQYIENKDTFYCSYHKFKV